MTYNPNQPRAPAGTPIGGQWVGNNVSRRAFDKMTPEERAEYVRGGGAISDHHVEELYERIAKPDGGFTYQPLTANEPAAGYAVSIFPDRSFGADASQMRLDDLVNYVVQNADLLSDPGNHIGAWHDPETHRVYLDISRVVPTPDRAASLARAHDQIAYFDLSRGQSVTVNRDATSGGAVK